MSNLETKTNNESNRKNNLSEPKEPHAPQIQSPHSSRGTAKNYERVADREDDEYEYFRRPKKTSNKKSKSTSPKPVPKYKMPENDASKILANINSLHISDITGGVVKDDEYIGKPLGLKF